MVIVFFGFVPVISAGKALATTDSRVCAQLDPSQGGGSFTILGGSSLELTVVTGDRINASVAGGFDVVFAPPGGVLQNTTSPAVFNVGAGQAGVWQFIGPGAAATVSCTIEVAIQPEPEVADTGPTAEDRSKITDGLLSTFNQFGGSIFSPDGIPNAIVNSHNENGGPHSTLSPTGLNLTSRVDTRDPFYDKYGLGLGQEQSDGLADQTSSSGFNFSFDLRSQLAKTQMKDLTGAFVGDRRDSNQRRTSPWNSWVSGRYVDFEDDNVDADRDGSLWWVTSGLSYQLTDHTSVGAFSRMRKGEVDSTALAAQLESDFYGGGVFVATRTANGIGMLAAVLYEKGDNDILLAGTSASFDTNQWTVEGRVDKRFDRGLYWIEPALKVLYTDSERDSYTDSAGTSVSGSNTRLGRLTFGPTVGTTIKRSWAEIRPFARINGVWDFVNEGDFALSNGAVISNADTAINLGGGVEIALASGIVVTTAGDWFAFDDDLDGWSATSGVGASLATLGLGNLAPTGFASLNFATTAEAQSGKARMVVPLN